MMRVVFLLFAEERGLLPQGQLFAQGYGISGELDAPATGEPGRSERSPRRHLPDLAPAARHLPGPVRAAPRSRTCGCPSYGGSLFDPARFPFLTAAPANQGTLAIASATG